MEIPMEIEREAQEELHESLRPYLTAIPREEALDVWRIEQPWQIQGRGLLGQERWTRLNLPTYALNPGAELWQLAANSTHDVLSNLFGRHDGGGIIIRLSSFTFAVFSKHCQYLDITVRTRDGLELAFVGPVLKSYFKPNGGQRRDLACCRLYIHATAIPSLMRDDLSLLKNNLQAILRLVTRLRLPDDIISEDYSRRLVIGPHTQNVDLDDIFSRDCLQTSFCGDWLQSGHLCLAGYDPSPSEWLALEEFTFHYLKILYAASIPWRFFQNTKSAAVKPPESCTILERPLGSASPISATLVFKDWLLDTTQVVDQFCREWLSISANVVFKGYLATLEAWKYLWSSSALVGSTTNWTSLSFSDCHIQDDEEGDALCYRHLDVIPRQRDWVLSWIPAEYDDEPGILQVRRISRSILTYPRNRLGLLFSDTPPTDIQQSVILSALINSNDDPDTLYKLLRAYCHILRRPRTVEARLQDTETSIIELRASSMEHQSAIDLLMEAMSAQQQQNARDMHELMEAVTRDFPDKQEMASLRRQVQALTEQNRLLVSRLHALEG